MNAPVSVIFQVLWRYEFLSCLNLSHCKYSVLVSCLVSKAWLVSLLFFFSRECGEADTWKGISCSKSENKTTASTDPVESGWRIEHQSRLPPLLQMLYVDWVSVDLNLTSRVSSGHSGFLPPQNWLLIPIRSDAGPPWKPPSSEWSFLGKYH